MKMDKQKVCSYDHDVSDFISSDPGGGIGHE